MKKTSRDFEINGIKGGRITYGNTVIHCKKFSVINGRMHIDGIPVTTKENVTNQPIQIVINGPVEEINCGAIDKIKVNGDVGKVNIDNGNLDISSTKVNGIFYTANGNTTIDTQLFDGSVETTDGNINIHSDTSMGDYLSYNGSIFMGGRKQYVPSAAFKKKLINKKRINLS